MSKPYHHDYIIIGAGPAGIQLAYYLKKNKTDYLVLEKGEGPGTFFKTHPRHRKLISINKVHTGSDDFEINLRWDWNSLLSDQDTDLLFKKYTDKYFPDADDLVEYLDGFANKSKLNIRTETSVVNITKDNDEIFHLELNTGEPITCKVLVVATGLYTPYIPMIKGIENAKTYCDMSVNGNDYNNKKVLILGKGNSAFETADALIPHASMIHVSSPNPLKMAWTTHYVGHLRAVNNNFLDTYQLKSQNGVLDANIESIEKKDGVYSVIFKYAHAECETETICYDEVLACTGFKFDTNMFDEKCMPEICPNGRFPMQTNEWESKNIKNLYFAGTLMQYLDHKKYMSGFIHGFRYNVKTLHRLLLNKYNNTEIDNSCIDITPDSLCNSIIERVNSTSALWQQPGFLCDIFVIEEDKVRVIEELCVDYCLDKYKNHTNGFFILTLEFGKTKFDNPFNISRIARDNINKSKDSNFLHPVIKYYVGKDMISEHHVIEDLFAEWREPEHILPLISYFSENIKKQEKCIEESMPVA